MLGDSDAGRVSCYGFQATVTNFRKLFAGALSNSTWNRTIADWMAHGVNETSMADVSGVKGCLKRCPPLLKRSKHNLGADLQFTRVPLTELELNTNNPAMTSLESIFSSGNNPFADLRAANVL